MSAPRNGAGGRLGALLLILLSLSACLGNDGRSRLTMAPPPVSEQDVPYIGAGPVDPGMPLPAIALYRGGPGGGFPPPEARALSTSDDNEIVNCSIRDRFDRGDTIAYEFNEGRSRLGLRVSMDGADLKDPGQMELKSVLVRYHHRFKGKADPRRKCRYESSWQGVVGSAYNEMFLREGKTVWDELDDHNAAFWRR